MQYVDTLWMYLHAEFVANAQWNHYVTQQCLLSQQVCYKQVWKWFATVDFNQNENASISILNFRILAKRQCWHHSNSKNLWGGAQMLQKRGTHSHTLPTYRMHSPILLIYKTVCIAVVTSATLGTIWKCGCHMHFSAVVSVQLLCSIGRKPLLITRLTKMLRFAATIMQTGQHKRNTLELKRTKHTCTNSPIH